MKCGQCSREETLSRPKLHPLTRIMVVVLLTGSSLVWQNLLLLCGLLAGSLVLAISGKPDRKQLLQFRRQGRFLLPVILSIFILQALFVKSGHLVLSIGFLHIYGGGVQIALAVTLRLLIILLSALYLAGLNLSDYLVSFKLLRLPEELALMTAMTITFIPLLSRQMASGRQQLILRGIDIGELPFRLKLLLYSKLVLPVLGRTLEDVKYHAVALEMRGFRNGRKHTCHKLRKLALPDWLVILGGWTAVILITFLLPVSH